MAKGFRGVRRWTQAAFPSNLFSPCILSESMGSASIVRLLPAFFRAINRHLQSGLFSVNLVWWLLCCQNPRNRVRIRLLVGQFYSFLKQIRVCSCPFKNNTVCFYLINQHPIRFNVTFTSRLPVANQLVVSMNRIKHFFRHRRADDYFQLFKVFPTLFHPLGVTVKLLCICR